MTGVNAFLREAGNLVLHPRSAWKQAPDQAVPSFLTWQIAGGCACLALLLLRLAGLAASHPVYRGAGGGILIGAAVTVELLGYFLYLPVGAWVAAVVLRAAHPDLRFSTVFKVFSSTTVPLLVGWIARTAVAWLRPAPAVATAGGFHDYVAALWTALDLRSDPSVLIGSPVSPPAIAAQVLGLFWIWHAVVLWSGLETSMGVRRRWALAVLATLGGVVLVAHLAEASLSAHWRELLVWSD